MITIKIGTMRLIIIFIIAFPFTVYGQAEDDEYYIQVIDYIQNSIIESESGNFNISNFIERKTEFSDFHGISTGCEIQHQLFLEILLNGEQSALGHDVTVLIPNHLQEKNKLFKIVLGTIISYKNIWATVITVQNSTTQENLWTKYSLLFVGDKLIVEKVGDWHGD